ncbi:MAG TPA: carboxypeptidase-like regulatory domain-containing protein, partial [Dyadobacter sp.]|nr:carboxypeptidase-like regulatory domain-containing protein [Dyadobacter sp.]
MRISTKFLPGPNGWVHRLLCMVFVILASAGYGIANPRWVASKITLNAVLPTIDKTVKGTIKDETGSVLAGVSVVEKGTTNGTITNQDGTFSLSVRNEGAVLSFSFIGFASQEIAVGNQSAFELVMAQDTKLLDEAIIQGPLGMKLQEKALGYAVQKIGGDAIQTVKGVNLATSLTGKVAGLWVKNSTEFNEAPALDLRGETPLLVIDGIPYVNISLKNLNQDDIESIDVLKGPTAAALYGSRGGSGAVIVTTKRGAAGKGLSVSVNSNNMFNAGFLMLPEAQSSYSAGLGSAYSPTDYIWGAKLDNGTMASQWNPISKQMEMAELRSIGKDNFRDFLVPGLISNNNVSISQTGENGSFRVSVGHIYNKGQYPNLKSNNTTFNVSGEMKVGEKFKLNSQLGYNRLTAPQVAGSGYDAQGYIYNILVWMGPEYRLSDYKDNYWLTPNLKQNWLYNAWYDNPYLMAYEKLNGVEENKMNASFTATLDLFEGAKLIVRPGFDLYQNNETRRNPPGILSTRGWDAAGLYSIVKKNGYS